jgi:hypothetical protein
MKFLTGQVSALLLCRDISLAKQTPHVNICVEERVDGTQQTLFKCGVMFFGDYVLSKFTFGRLNTFWNKCGYASGLCHCPETYDSSHSQMNGLPILRTKLK